MHPLERSPNRPPQGYDYNSDELLTSSIPSDTLRLCLRYGISAIDTSPYYTTSEKVLGKAFKDVADEFPRESYTIITKAGRYGRTKEEGFDYSPERIRKSIKNSLELFGTTYIDGCYMHDGEETISSLRRAMYLGSQTSELTSLPLTQSQSNS